MDVVPSFMFASLFVSLLREPRVIKLTLDPLPLQQPTPFIIYYHSAHAHIRAHIHIHNLLWEYS